MWIFIVHTNYFLNGGIIMNIKFNINEDLNEIFEKKVNTYSAIRKVSWVEK